MTKMQPRTFRLRRKDHDVAELRDLVLDDRRLRVLGRAERQVVALVRETIPEQRVCVLVDRGVDDDEDRVARARPRDGGEDEPQESYRTPEKHTVKVVADFDTPCCVLHVA